MSQCQSFATSPNMLDVDPNQAPGEFASQSVVPACAIGSSQLLQIAGSSTHHTSSNYRLGFRYHDLPLCSQERAA
jgi:hypothetical protein